MITTIRPNKMPTLWWLFPWSYARTLHMSANAVKAYADRLDDILDIQRGIIEEQAADIRLLKARVRDQDDAIIKGTAIITDAQPYNAVSERDQDEPYTRADDLRISE
jgi:hypothetical protein